MDELNIPPSQIGINNIDYDAKGRRLRIDYDNEATTFYEYDPFTFRLIHVVTLRNAVTFPNDCLKPPLDGWPGCHVQNLLYTYDPIGNIMHILDDAQQTIYFRNKRVEPSLEYTYDALYRLIETRGREHLGQVGGPPIPNTNNDANRIGLIWSENDGNVMGNYMEQYVYDPVGNFLSMHHRGNDPARPGWTRSYTYDEASLIESTKPNNRLSNTIVGNNNSVTERYVYDVQGNMIRTPDLAINGDPQDANIHWDYKDRLQQADFRRRWNFLLYL